MATVSLAGLWYDRALRSPAILSRFARSLELLLQEDDVLLCSYLSAGRVGQNWGDKLNPVQEAFITYGGFQCGACTPGQIVAATSLLENKPDPSEAEIKEWMMGNLCRCTGYYQIIEAIQNAAKAG